MQVTGQPSPSAANPKAAASAKSSNETAVDAASNAVTGDFETFLKLLTTQMQNQDPLNPADSTEFVAQLASFSAVEQQVRANDRLDSILGVLSGSSAGLAEWIGRDVKAAAKADFSGEPIEVGVTPKEGADSTVLVVRNDFDREVARLTVDASSGTVSWDGKDAAGTTLAHGRYAFSLESFDGDTLLGAEPGQVFAKVDEVRLVDGTPKLVLADGTQVGIDEIGGVR